MEEITKQCYMAVSELIEIARLKEDSILIVGCSTSEVCGSRIGTNSNEDVAALLYEGISSAVKEKGVYLAVQCCEHLNRAVVVERAAVPYAEYVNVVPQKKAGGSLATKAYHSFSDPVVVETIKADAGIDIGGTLIGMHLKQVAVPVRLSISKIGQANIICARTRPKFIGGERAVYDKNLL
ncbi:MAG: TIGR01440 family protein [Candidatus Coproplasma sp.]